MEIKELTEPAQLALADMHITSFSEVQTTIPDALAGKDLLIQSPTGSGKTLAYLIPIVERLMPQGKGKHFPDALILVPTRELALQTADTARKLLAHTEGFRTAVLTGGEDIQKQIRSFSKGADIVIATPARLLDHLRRHTFKPKLCSTLVLDEADVMLSMGFIEDVRNVIAALPGHQTLLYSATLSDEVRELSTSIQNEPVSYTFGASKLLVQNTPVTAVVVAKEQKLDVLWKLLKEPEQTLLFVNTRKTCAFVSSELSKHHIPCLALYSGLDPRIRKQHMEQFRNGSCKILVATDVASRGIDIPSVKRIILYDFPDEAESLIHRIGRTSRANTKGEAFLLLTERQKDKVQLAEQLLHEPVQVREYKHRKGRKTFHSDHKKRTVR